MCDQTVPLPRLQRHARSVRVAERREPLSSSSPAVGTGRRRTGLVTAHADGSTGVPPAVIVAVDTIQGLQLARIMARHRVPVIGIAANRRQFSCRTRSCRVIVESQTWGDPLVESLQRLGPRFSERPVLLPCTDEAVLTISRARSELQESFRYLLPPSEAVEMLMDKRRFLEYARAADMPVPPFAVMTNPDEALSASDSLRFPCVIKPALKTPRWQSATGVKAFRVVDAGQFMSVYDRTSQWTDTLIAQEWVAGEESDLYSCNCVFDAASKPVATFVARKLRQWPPGTGYSSLGEECRNDAVLDATVRLFRDVSFAGLGYVEMKRDARSGEHFIIEPNIGRPTRRSPIAEAGGVELHYAAYAEAAGLPRPTQLEQRYGRAKWIHLRDDVPAALQQWRRGRLTLPGYLRSLRGIRSDAVLSLRDPGPGIAELTEAVARVARKARRPNRRSGRAA